MLWLLPLTRSCERVCRGTSTNRKSERVAWEVSEGGEKATQDAAEMEGESGSWSTMARPGLSCAFFPLGTGQG